MDDASSRFADRLRVDFRRVVLANGNEVQENMQLDVTSGGEADRAYFVYTVVVLVNGCTRIIIAPRLGACLVLHL